MSFRIWGSVTPLKTHQEARDTARNAGLDFYICETKGPGTGTTIPLPGHRNYGKSAKTARHQNNGLSKNTP